MSSALLLTSIRMFAETLLHRGPADRETHDEFLGTIVDESNRLSRLLGNVLEFSAIEGGKRQYQMQPRDLGEIVQAAVRAIQQRLDSEQFVLKMALDEGLPPVPVDGDAIEQAVLNLLTNAMKYSRDSRRIDLGLRREDGNAVIAVSDRGMGIRPLNSAGSSRAFSAPTLRRWRRYPEPGWGSRWWSTLSQPTVGHRTRKHTGPREHLHFASALGAPGIMKIAFNPADRKN